MIITITYFQSVNKIENAKNSFLCKNKKNASAQFWVSQLVYSLVTVKCVFFNKA